MKERRATTEKTPALSGVKKLFYGLSKPKIH